MSEKSGNEYYDRIGAVLRSAGDSIASKNIGKARCAMVSAYMAGRWRGQVDLEINYDLGQYGTALAESHCARITGLPSFPASTGRTVTVNLRSDRWREGVDNSSKTDFEKAFAELEKIIQKLEFQNARLRSMFNKCRKR